MISSGSTSEEADNTVFDGDWLALREPADHAARDATMLASVWSHLKQTENPRIVDIACGRGSTIAALDPDNTLGAEWHLLDQDTALLADALNRFPAHHIRTGRCDLRSAVISADQFGDIVPAGTDLITMSAFIDLVSLEWLAHFALRCAQRAVPVYCALSIDGTVEFDPSHVLDTPVLQALAHHEQTDKGFGTALGPGAPYAFSAAFGRAGFVVDQAKADWKLGASEAPLARALLDGWAEAVMESGQLEPERADDWIRSRRQSVVDRDLVMTVGHIDAFARLPHQDVTKL
ncbi:MAG: class I SAM-dependent methyltransferase [Pseudomonadota bacterium]